MQNILLISITPTKANRSLFSSESKDMFAIEDTIETTIKKHNGALFYHSQKEFFSIFTNDLSLNCAIEIFDLLLELLGTKNIRAIRLSIGSGTTLELGSYYTGMALFQAKRLDSICPPGQILLTKSLFSTLPTPSSANIFDYGVSQLNDLEEPMHLMGTTSNAEINPMRITDKRISVPTNLRTHHTSLTGRKTELRDLKSLILDNRLISITGASGTGKTRLALHVGAECHKVFKHGVFHIYFDDKYDIRKQIFQLSSILGLAFDSIHNIEDQLYNYLRTKKVLIIADCQNSFSKHQISLFKKIIQNTKSIRLLMTTRDPLYIFQENVYPIKNLPLPPSSDLEIIFDSSHAAHLYINQALTMHPDLHLQPSDIEEVVDICTILKGNPQAIIMAAAWSKTLSIKELLATLQELIPEFEEKEHLVAGLPSRNNQLRAMFEATLQNLNNDEYDAFIKLSIFKSGFTKDDALKATGVSETIITRLYNKSPLQQATNKRYYLHKVFQRIAYDKLIASNHLNAIHENFYQYFLDITYQKALQIQSKDQHEMLTFFHSNKENILSAWHLCLDKGSLREIEKFMTPLFDFFEIAFLNIEGVSAFEPLKNTLEDSAIEPNGTTNFCMAKVFSLVAVFYKNLNHPNEAEQLFLRSLALWDTVLETPDSVREFKKNNDIQLEYARTLTHYGDLLCRINQTPKALQYTKDSLKIFITLNDTPAIAWTHSVLGQIFLNSGAQNKAIEHFKESLTQYKYSNSPSGIVWAQQNLAHCFYNSGNFAEAQKYYPIKDFEQNISKGYDNLSLLTPVENEDLDLKNLYTLVNVHHEMGNYVKALHLAEQALVVSSQQNNNKAIADAILLMATITSSIGNYKKAKTQFQEALGIYQSEKLSIGQSKVNIELARLHYYTGNTSAMTEYLKHVDTTVFQNKTNTLAIDYDNIMGLNKFLYNAIPLAEELFQKAHTASITMQYESGIIRALKNLTKIELSSGNYKKAAAIFSDIINSASKEGFFPIILESMLDLSQILIDKKDYEYAMDILIYIYNHKCSNAFTKNSAKKNLFKMPPKYGKQFFFYCINNEEHRDINDFSRNIISNIEIALQHT